MYLIEVVPISNTFGNETLTYFHTENLQTGALISIPLRNKTEFGLVAKSIDARNRKMDIKKSDFSLKKISRVVSKEPPFVKEFLRSAQNTAQMFSSSTGAVLDSLIPKNLLENFPEHIKRKRISEKKNSEVILVEGSEKFRYETYQEKIKKILGKGENIFIICPAKKNAESFYENINEFFPDSSLLIHGKIAKKKMLSSIKEILEESNPICVIGTPMALCLVDAKTGLFIIEKEGNESYRSQRKPLINFRFAIESLAKELNADLILADEILSFESLFKYETSEKISESEREPEITITDMRTEEGKKMINPFIGKSLEETLKKFKKEKVFIYSPRKGLASSTFCKDCGQAVLCNNCHTSVTLYENKPKNIFLCHSCGSKRSAHEVCKSCGGWNLVSLGLGIEKLKSDLEKLYPDIPIFVISKDKTSTEKKVLEEFEKWEEEGGILLGTQMALPFIQSADISVIASLDAMLSLPEHSLHENVLRTIFEIRNKTNNQLIIQSRNPEDKFIEWIQKGSLEEFRKEERSFREKLGYPPFKTLIKISVPEKQGELAEKIKISLAPFSPKVYESPPSKSRRGNVLNILLRLGSDNWPDLKLRNYLIALPPYVTTEVNPKNLF